MRHFVCTCHRRDVIDGGVWHHRVAALDSILLRKLRGDVRVPQRVQVMRRRFWHGAHLAGCQPIGTHREAGRGWNGQRDLQ